MERKISVLPLGGPTHIPKGMVEKGLERESDDVIVGENPYLAEGLKRFIVQIAMCKMIHEPEIGWAGKVGT